MKNFIVALVLQFFAVGAFACVDFSGSYRSDSEGDGFRFEQVGCNQITVYSPLDATTPEISLPIDGVYQQLEDGLYKADWAGELLTIGMKWPGGNTETLVYEILADGTLTKTWYDHYPNGPVTQGPFEYQRVK